MKNEYSNPFMLGLVLSTVIVYNYNRGHLRGVYEKNC
mgnify:CR=1 FL=1